MGMTKATTYTKEEIELKLRRIISRRTLNPGSLEIREVRACEEDRVYLELCKYLAYEINKEELHDVYFTYPSSWWQMFKRDVAPFLLKIWPLKTKTNKQVVKVERGTAYPSLAYDPAIPVKFIVTEDKQ